MVKLEKGRSKPVKKKNHSFAAVVSNVFGIGGKKSTANLIALSETPLDLFTLIDTRDDLYGDQETLKKRYKNIRVPAKLVIRQTSDKKGKKKVKKGEEFAHSDTPTCSPNQPLPNEMKRRNQTELDQYESDHSQKGR